MKTTSYKFEGYDEVHQAEEWCLEDQAEQTRSRLGIPIWIDYKIIEDAHPEPYPDLTSYLSNVCDSPEPTVVPKRTRKAKAKLEAIQLPNVQLVLDDTNPLNIVPGVLRDKFDRSTPAIPRSIPK
jgi:hypothetical protein